MRRFLPDRCFAVPGQHDFFHIHLVCGAALPAADGWGRFPQPHLTIPVAGDRPAPAFVAPFHPGVWRDRLVLHHPDGRSPGY